MSAPHPTAPSSPSHDVFIGRQPIYNQNLGVVAYELLFRSDTDSIRNIDGTRATAQVVLNSLVEIGLDRLVGSRKAAINVTEKFLHHTDSLPVEPERVMLEIPADMPVTPTVLSTLKQLRGRGFTLVLDDFSSDPARRPLAALADIIKLDTGTMKPEEVQQEVACLRKLGKPLLAEKIEYLDEFEFLRDLGFSYFQGDFLSRPRVLRTKSLPANRVGVMRLLAALHDPDSETAELAAVIGQDLSLSYKLLKLINSAFFALPRQIDSIGHAINLLGRTRLTAWASVLGLSGLDDRPPEMIRIAMIRAKTCELLAAHARIKPVEGFFAVGLLSALDIVMERPLAELLEPLPLSNAVRGALLSGQGQQGAALACALAFEQPERGSASFWQLTRGECSEVHLEATAWADQVLTALG
jgi:EAL and modified HD-GYP domain-containing signal transduction protein